jgi:hypothetical protein
MNRLRETLSQTWLNIQGSLFPWLSEELGPLTDKQQELVTTLELVRIEKFIYPAVVIQAVRLKTARPLPERLWLKWWLCHR